MAGSLRDYSIGVEALDNAAITDMLARLMWRPLFTLCSAGSLLACAAVCLLWACSYLVPSVGEETIYTTPSLRVVLERGGGLRLTTGTSDRLFACAPAASATAALPISWGIWVARSRRRRRQHGFPIGSCSEDRHK